MTNPAQPTIASGVTGDVVCRLQRALRRKSNLDVIVDGVFGPTTMKAVKDFQWDAGLDDNGVVGARTWAALPDGRPMPVLQNGSKGDVVSALQKILTDGASGQWKTTPGAVDGDFGPTTEASVKAFQVWGGVPADGIVGDATWAVPLHTLKTAVGRTRAALSDGRPMPVLQNGSKGDVVSALQKILTDGASGQWKTTPGAVDGDFGPTTEASVKAFQVWGGLPADGIVGDATWAAPLRAPSATLETAVGLQFAFPPPIPAREVKLTVSSQFMQDYTTARRVLETLSLEETYVARDGTLNIYSPVGFGQPEDHPSIDRLHASADSPTGWALDRHALPPERPATETASTGGPPNTWVLPTVIIAPTARLDKRQLLVFRRDSIQIATLGDDGSIDGNITTKAKSPSIPMLHGGLADGTRYLPELEVDSSGAVHRVMLRDLHSMDTYPVDTSAIPVSKGWLSGTLRAIFPARESGPDLYRFVALEERGDVTATLLHLDSRTKNFVVKERKPIGHSKNGCVAVREARPGQVEVFIVNVPDVQAITGVYTGDSNSVGTWKPPVSTKLTGALPVDPKVAKRFNIATGPGTGPARLMLFAQPPTPADWKRPANIDFADRSGYWACEKAPTEIWTTPSLGEQFDPLVQVDRGIRFISFVPNDSHSFVAFRPHSGFEVWRRGESRDFEIEAIRVEDQDAKLIDTACYRVGVTLNVSAQSLPGQEFAIKASLTSYASIAGRTVVIAPNNAAQATTDATGSLWVVVIVADRLAALTLVLSCPLFDHDVVVDLGQEIRTKLANITASELKDATDPRNGKKVLPDPDHADAVTGAITQLMKQAPPSVVGAPHPVVGAAPGGAADRGGAPALFAHSKVAARLVPRAEAAHALAPIPAQAGSSWRLSLTDGELQFEIVKPATAVEHHERMLGADPHPIVGGMFDFITKPIEDYVINPIEDHVINPIRDKANQVKELVVDNGKLALTVVINGVEFTYHGVIENVGHVYDAIYWVLDQAGVELGTMIGWLLDKLGFLFDWGAFLKKRDELRKLVCERARLVTTTLPDPGAAFASARGKLDQYESSAVSYLTSLRSGPTGGKTFGELLGLDHAPTLPALLETPAGSLLPQVTWLMDKVMSVLPTSRWDLGLPNNEGFATLDADLSRRLAPLLASMESSATEIAGLAAQLVASVSSFSASLLDPLLEMLIKQVKTLFTAMKAVLDVIGGALHGLWAQPEQVIEWLDQEIHVPFLSGFYRGLTKAGRLSVFDLACLVAAIPAVLLEKTGASHPTSSRATTMADVQTPLVAAASAPLLVGAPGPSLADRHRLQQAGGPVFSTRDKLHQAGLCFSIQSCVFNTLDGVITAGTSRNKSFEVEKLPIGLMIAGLNVASTLGGVLCNAWEEDSTKEAETITGLISGATTLALLALARRSSRPEVLDLLALLNVGVQIYRFEAVAKERDVVKDNFNLLFAQLINTVQAIANCSIRTKRPLPLQQAVAYGALQGLLSGARTGVYYGRPL